MPCLQPADDHGFTLDEAEVIYWGTCLCLHDTTCLTAIPNHRRNTLSEDVASTGRCPVVTTAPVSSRDWWRIPRPVGPLQNSPCWILQGSFDFSRRVQNPRSCRRQAGHPGGRDHLAGTGGRRTTDTTALCSSVWRGTAQGPTASATAHGGAGNGDQQFLRQGTVGPTTPTSTKARRPAWPVPEEVTAKKLSWADLMVLAGTWHWSPWVSRRSGFGGGRETCGSRPRSTGQQGHLAGRRALQRVTANWRTIGGGPDGPYIHCQP